VSKISVRKIILLENDLKMLAIVKHIKGVLEKYWEITKKR